MKKVRLIIVCLLFIAMSVVFVAYRQGQLSYAGNYYDNLADFGVEKECEKEESSPLAQAYMKSITYEIIDIGKETMNATVKVSVPQVSDTLVQIVEQVMEDNPEAETEQIKELAIQNFQQQLEKGMLPSITDTLLIPIERELFAYNLNPGEEWYDFTMGQLEELYLEYYRLMIGELTNEAPNN